MADRTRQTFKARFRGMNVVTHANALQEGKYPIAVNVRGEGEDSVGTRPGYLINFATGGSRATDMKAYATLGTDNKPRILVHDLSGRVYMDDGGLKGTVGSGGPGASMIPFRPNQSPQSWMYIANPTGYQKFSAPTAANVVTQAKVGIAEPQSSPEVCEDGILFTEFTGGASAWTKAGTGGTLTDATRSSEITGGVFADPNSVSPAYKTRYSVHVGTAIKYQIGEVLLFTTSGGSVTAVVEDVLPAIASTLVSQSVTYFSGTTGRCVIVPTQIAVGPSTPIFDMNGNPTAGSTFVPGETATLRRGSLITIGVGGTLETVMVLSVTSGPNGIICFECITTNNHPPGEMILGVPAIVCSGLTGVATSSVASSADITTVATKGIATWTKTLSTNPFSTMLGTVGVPQSSDYVHISLLVDNSANLDEVKIQFDIGDGTFTGDYLYYSIDISSFQDVANNLITQFAGLTADEKKKVIEEAGAVARSTSGTIFDKLKAYIEARKLYGEKFAIGTSPWTEILFPISSLKRVGSDQSKSLINCGKVQILANCNDGVSMAFSSIWVGGSGQPDVGSQGSPYFYRVRPRSITTGAKGNPSPSTRYGATPRRQRNIVSLPSAAYDTQIEVWDIFRYGGTVTSSNADVVGSPWRMIGTISSSQTVFIDNVFDDAALVGEALDFDNFEPWPSVDVPFQGTVGDGNITAITVGGTIINVIGTTFPTSIVKWLPGTLITLDGVNVFTLWNRPVAITGGYLFVVMENAGSPTVTTISVNEPNVANQVAPYVWGPSSEGVVFGVGDPLRPGVLNSSKQNDPDSSPNNVYDLTPPSEPLLGGEIVGGMSVCASSERWWALQPAFGTANRWQPMEFPAGRGLAAPWGHCTDGKIIYFWAKDGIYALPLFGNAVSLTDTDLYTLFPHDRTPGKDIVYAGVTVHAPDYKRASQFRMSIANSILKAHYLDTSGSQRTLVLDMSLDASGNPRMAWSVDVYYNAITTSYQPEQPEGTLSTSTVLYAQEYLSDSAGIVYVSQATCSDNGHSITAYLALPEWDAGDGRVSKQFLDAMLDCIPISGMTVTPVSDTLALGSGIPIYSSAVRSQSVVPVGSAVIVPYLGLLITWTDTSSSSSVNSWSLEFVAQPLSIRFWESVPTTHGMEGYHHIRKLILSYAARAAVTLTITSYDGISPAVITLPSTGGSFVRVEFIPSYNKGMLYTYMLSSSDVFAFSDIEVQVGAWERSSNYSIFRDLGGNPA